MGGEGRRAGRGHRGPARPAPAFHSGLPLLPPERAASPPPRPGAQRPPGAPAGRKCCRPRGPTPALPGPGRGARAADPPETERARAGRSPPRGLAQAQPGVGGWSRRELRAGAAAVRAFPLAVFGTRSLPRRRPCAPFSAASEAPEALPVPAARAADGPRPCFNSRAPAHEPDSVEGRGRRFVPALNTAASPKDGRWRKDRSRPGDASARPKRRAHRALPPGPRGGPRRDAAGQGRDVLGARPARAADARGGAEARAFGPGPRSADSGCTGLFFAWLQHVIKRKVVRTPGGLLGRASTRGFRSAAGVGFAGWSPLWGSPRIFCSPLPLPPTCPE